MKSSPPYLSGARRERIVWRASLALLVLSLLTFTACSTSADFVVLNRSGQPVDVEWKLTYTPSLKGVPVVAPISVLDEEMEERRWKELPGDRYRIDQMTNIVTARLMPGEALRLSVVVDPEWINDANAMLYLPVREIALSGASGELKLGGTQVYKHFSKESGTLYALTYK